MSNITTAVSRTIDWCYPVGEESHEWILTRHGSDDCALYHNGELAFSFTDEFLPDLIALLSKKPEEDERVYYCARPPQ